MGVWVVCSKNVALIAKKREDINYYTDTRFVFAKEMAHVWFDKLETDDPTLVAKLKTELTGHTLIGEYIGSIDH